jgi:predicted enzyme related to lactoylglutathione lyase
MSIISTDTPTRPVHRFRAIRAPLAVAGRDDFEGYELMKIEAESSRDVLIQSDVFNDAVSFYEAVLGLRVTHRSETLVGFETGSFCLYVEKGPSYGPVFEFYVSDLAIAKEKPVAAGCCVESEDSSIPRCYVRDPFGLIFNLAERKHAEP